MSKGGRNGKSKARAPRTPASTPGEGAASEPSVGESTQQATTKRAEDTCEELNHECMGEGCMHASHAAVMDSLIRNGAEANERVAVLEEENAALKEAGAGVQREVERLRTQLEHHDHARAELERLREAVDMAYASASEYACYEYPGADQAELRDAYCRGFARATTSTARDRIPGTRIPYTAVTDKLEAGEKLEDILEAYPSLGRATPPAEGREPRGCPTPGACSCPPPHELERAVVEASLAFYEERGALSNTGQEAECDWVDAVLALKDERRQRDVKP